MTLLEMDFEAISTASRRAKKYSFTSLVATYITEASSLLRKIKNTETSLLLPIGGADLHPIITWKKVWSVLNLPRSASV